MTKDKASSFIFLLYLHLLNLYSSTGILQWLVRVRRILRCPTLPHPSSYSGATCPYLFRSYGPYQVSYYPCSWLAHMSWTNSIPRYATELPCWYIYFSWFISLLSCSRCPSSLSVWFQGYGFLLMRLLLSLSIMRLSCWCWTDSSRFWYPKCLSSSDQAISGSVGCI